MPLDYMKIASTIQEALLLNAKQGSSLGGVPPRIWWGDRYVQTADRLAVPKCGQVIAEIRSVDSKVEQGFDLKCDGGGFNVGDGSQISTLRTWHDVELPNKIKYSYVSSEGVIWFWNVYKRRWPTGRCDEEKWVDNAGFWIEQLNSRTRRYHCSHGLCEEPNFQSLVVDVQILPKE